MIYNKNLEKTSHKSLNKIEYERTFNNNYIII